MEVSKGGKPTILIQEECWISYDQWKYQKAWQQACEEDWLHYQWFGQRINVQARIKEILAKEDGI